MSLALSLLIAEFGAKELDNLDEGDEEERVALGVLESFVDSLLNLFSSLGVSGGGEDTRGGFGEGEEAWTFLGFVEPRAVLKESTLDENSEELELELMIDV